jgi:hypothetical protein
MTAGNNKTHIQARGYDGEIVRVVGRAPLESERKLIFQAYAFIANRVDDSSWRKNLLDAMRVSTFIVTEHRSIGAYTQQTESGAIVILNKRLFSSSVVPFDDFCVTICHELIHVIEEQDPSFDPMSEREARHDFLTYSLLGLEIRSDHWGSKKYPHILEEFRRLEDT